MQHGLTYGWMKWFRFLFCYTDSKNVIQLISNDLNPCNWYASVIQSIKDLLRHNWEVQISHTLREGNDWAIFLAKERAVDVNRWTKFETPPAGLALPSLIPAMTSSVLTGTKFVNHIILFRVTESHPIPDFKQSIILWK